MKLLIILGIVVILYILSPKGFDAFLKFNVGLIEESQKKNRIK